MDSPINPSVFARRRARMAQALSAAGGGVAIVPTAPVRLRNADSDYPYRHDSCFFHLSGFAEPDAWLVLDAHGHETLFCRPRDADREIWDGYRVGPERVPALLGIEKAYATSSLDEKLPELLANQPAVWFAFAGHEGLQERVGAWLGAVRGHTREGWSAPPLQRDLAPLLDDLRLLKDEAELALMRRAAAISAGAHVRAMQFCAARLRGGANDIAEYEIEAELLHEFRRHGATGVAYSPIVAAGANTCILHHVAGSACIGPAASAGRLKHGDLCLIDAGCEYGSYAADITRTFPADGRFTGPQRAVYEVVLAAQEAALATVAPGCRRSDAHHAAVRVLAQGMLDLRLLRGDQVGTLDDVIQSAAYRRFYMHGTGHWLGLDVHDVGDYLARDEPPIEQPDGLGGRVVRHPSRKLVCGMALTIEPGLYVRPAPDVPPAFWNIGVRIEDDVVVTPQGCELLSRGVPVSCDEIEALMRG